MKSMFSIVIPVYNEEDSLRELVKKIETSLSKFKKPYEIIFVDDGSYDRTLEILKILSQKDKKIKVFSFRKNLGKSYALMLGFKKAKGDYIVMLDADLQDDPGNINVLYQRLVKGNFDMVTGWRKNRHDPLSKKMSSLILSKFLVPLLFRFKMHDLNSGLKIFRAEVAKEIKIYGGMYRFIPLVAHEMGYKVGEKEISHHPRKYGKSKYKPTHMVSDVPDLITIYFLTKYTTRPLHFFGKIGTILSIIGVALLLYLIINFAITYQAFNNSILLIAILFITLGVLVICTGLLADLFVTLSARESDDYPIKYKR